MCRFRPVWSGMLIASLSLSADAVGAQTYPEFAPDHLKQGRAIWLGTCEGCHAYGIAGAPNPRQPQAWRSRLMQQKPVLYAHAIEGFFGPGGTMMPPRGGNQTLTDEEVKRAVDYMVALVTFYDDENKVNN